jgi:hypothetical protein
MAGRGTHYDCWPAGPSGLRALLKTSGFSGQNRCPQAVRHTLEQQDTRPMHRLIHRAPDALLLAATPLMPSLVYLAHPLR